MPEQRFVARQAQLDRAMELAGKQGYL